MSQQEVWANYLHFSLKFGTTSEKFSEFMRVYGARVYGSVIPIGELSTIYSKMRAVGINT